MVDLGFYVSFSGIVTFRNADDVREAARLVPLDRLLVETDSPYLAPEPRRGGRNEPSRVVDVAKGLAVALGQPLEEMAERTVPRTRAGCSASMNLRARRDGALALAALRQMP